MQYISRFSRLAAAMAFVVLMSAPAAAGNVPLEEFSPGFLGMYRKLLEIDDEIQRHAAHYGVDVDLARAVCLYESGANPGLASHAGAQGYFQVMPRTYRELAAGSNIEAGVKYLAQMIRQFGREDRAVAAYNGGPGRLSKNGTMPLETLQYVVGVGYYRTVLKQYQESLRQHVASVNLATVQTGDDWPAIAARVNVPQWELRIYNPFLAGRTLRAGQQLAYPIDLRSPVFVRVADGAEYRMRHGDHYIQLAITMGVSVDDLRRENSLWHLQIAPVGMTLRIPNAIDREGVVRSAVNGAAPVTAVATRTIAPPPVSAKQNLAPAPLALSTHRVKRGDTLMRLARKYSTTVAAIQRENNLRGTTLKAGQLLRIPGQPAVTSR